jgi:hypothetical protein
MLSLVSVADIVLSYFDPPENDIRNAHRGPKKRRSVNKDAKIDASSPARPGDTPQARQTALFPRTVQVHYYPQPGTDCGAGFLACSRFEAAIQKNASPRNCAGICNNEAFALSILIFITFTTLVTAPPHQ